MHRQLTILSIALLTFLAGVMVATRIQIVHSQGRPGAGFAAVPGNKGGWDLTGPYDVVRDGPKPMSQLPATKIGAGAPSKACSRKAPTA